MGAKTPNTNDRRVRRTHERLHRAFGSLILERGYDAVTIRDVVGRAGVGRSTYYAHFGDLEEVLVARAVGHWLREFAAGSRDDRRPLGFLRPLLEHAHAHRRLWRAVAGKRGGTAVKEHLRQTLLVVIRDDLAALAAGQPAIILDGTVRYLTGAIVELLFWWLDSPTELTPAEVDEVFQRLTAPALKAMTGPR